MVEYNILTFLLIRVEKITSTTLGNSTTKLCRQFGLFFKYQLCYISTNEAIKLEIISDQMAEKQIFNPPERWLKCPRKGRLIADRFLPFKTPLSSNYRDTVPDRDTFPPSMLASQPIGLVIDLTKSERFYSPQELTALNISYHKIACEGHSYPPTKKQVSSLGLLF